MFGMNAIQWSIIAGVPVLFLLAQNRAKIASWLGSIRLPFTGKAAVAKRDDTADVAAFTTLRQRFTVNKCPEGLAALDTVWSHFWHGEGGE